MFNSFFKAILVAVFVLVFAVLAVDSKPVKAEGLPECPVGQEKQDGCVLKHKTTTGRGCMEHWFPAKANSAGWEDGPCTVNPPTNPENPGNPSNTPSYNNVVETKVCGNFELVGAVQVATNPSGKWNLARLDPKGVVPPQIFTSKISGNLFDPAISPDRCSLLHTIWGRVNPLDIYWGFEYSDGSYRVVNMTNSPNANDFAPKWLSNTSFVYLSQDYEKDSTYLKLWDNGIISTLAEVAYATDLDVLVNLGIVAVAQTSNQGIGRITLVYTKENGEVVTYELPTPEQGTEVDWTPDGLAILAISVNNNSLMYTTAPLNMQMWPYTKEVQTFHSLSYANHENAVAVGVFDGQVYLLNTNDIELETPITKVEWNYHYLDLNWRLGPKLSTKIPATNFDFIKLDN